ncbi:haloacid dehalogenase type II [Acerihabitans arboris]|uniref:Haloacid dehalogenase type II n=1 Tax=Acerihabitans arboris TaxID=2691583 RepID=A0A845SLR4_9GAMM|nr:haloacid dehalogenase type II [Acerihabitans arboris]NDL62225.1 haloacid dehalogenase type II [Acerihabitans arboris]
MAVFKPKYITFDCYGTLIKFEMAEAARAVFAERVDRDAMPFFLKDFAAFRLDEVLGAWKPYDRVVGNAIRRACDKWRVECGQADCDAINTAITTWGPHPDVPAGLAKVAGEFPLVLLTNSMNALIKYHVPRLGAPIHKVFTSEQAGAYKPQMKAFDYMLGQLDCGPGDILHVSSSLRYDLMTAHDMGIKHKVFVARGHEPSTPYYGYTEINDIGGLAAVVGL